MKKLVSFLVGVLVLLLLVVSIWCWVSAPCSWYRYSHVHDIPGRCLISK